MLGLYYTVFKSHTGFMQLNDLEGFAYLGLLSNIIAIPVSLLFAIPSFFLLRKYRLFKWWSVCIVGAVAGGLMGKDFPFGIIWLAMLGTISASIAWLFIVRSNIALKWDTPAARHLA